MNNLLPKNDNFSSPVVIPTGHDDSDQFEFGCFTTTGSPSSPADHLFSNGRLRPHIFPAQRTSNYCSSSLSRSASIISSNSARTSTSTEASCYSSSSSERRLSSNRIMRARRENNVTMTTTNNYNNNKPHLGSQRWQLIAAAPILKHQGGSRSKTESLDRSMSRKSRPIEAKTPWLGRRILKSFVSACKECHAITT